MNIEETLYGFAFIISDWAKKLSLPLTDDSEPCRLDMQDTQKD